MVRRKLIAVVAVLMAAGLSISACSDGGGSGSSSGGDDTGASTGDDTGPSDSGGGEEDSGPSGDGGGDASDGSGGTIDPKFDVDEENCSNASLPRCEKSPADFSDWGPASALTSLDVASEDAQGCCFDLNGDGSVDNALGTQVLSLLNSLNSEGPPIRQQLKQSLTNGELLVVTEHQGLSGLDSGDEFKANFFIGEYANAESANYLTKNDSGCSFADENCATSSQAGKEFLINPQSFDKGTQPQAQVPGAKIDGSKLNAGPGKVVLRLTIAGLGNLNLVINGATIESNVDKGNSSIENGIKLKEGKLGGYVLARDLVALINELMSSCSCLDNPQTTFEPPNMSADEPDLRPNACLDENNAPDNCDVACRPSVDEKTGDCSNTGSAICNFAGSLCSAGPRVFTEFPDLDVDGDGQKDAFSIGALFEATGAKITGVAPFISVTNQEVPSSSLKEVTVPAAFVNGAGHIVIHQEASGGGFGDVIGSEPISANWNRDVTVTLDREIKDNETLYAMLHSDDGNGTYDDLSTDPPIKLWEASATENGVEPKNNIVVEPFTVTKGN